MIYPAFLKENDTIGIVAMSSGVGNKLETFDESIRVLKSHSYRIKEDPNTRLNELRGGTAEERAEGLKKLYLDDEVKMIMCAAGGDFLYETLPYIDLEAIKRHPKWFMGASDPTSICFMITTKLDIATLYGLNAGSYYTGLKHLEDNLSILKGDLLRQDSYELFENTEGFLKEGVHLTNPVFWDSYGKRVDLQGRCLGGCLDVLKDLIGTPYEDVRAFNERYKDEGVVWYFDIFAMKAEAVYLTLLQMKAASWFDCAKGFVFGRVVFPDTFVDMSYKDAYRMALPEFAIISDADVGHTLPKMTLINGAKIHVRCENGSGSIAFKL